MMDTNDVTRLERDSRRWRTAAVLLAIAVGLCSSWDRRSRCPTEVKGRSLTLVTNQGMSRGTLYENGGPLLCYDTGKE